MATHAGMTTDEFAKIVADWLATAKHPRFERPYTELRLPADARAARLPARERLQDLHRLRRRRRVHARPGPSRSTASRPSRWSARTIETEFRARRDGKPVLIAPAEGRLHRRRPGKPVGHPASSSAAGRSSPSATPTATSRCSQWTAAGSGRALRGPRPPHRRRARVGLRPQVAHRPARQGARRGDRQGLDASST